MDLSPYPCYARVLSSPNLCIIRVQKIQVQQYYRGREIGVNVTPQQDRVKAARTF